MNFSTVRETQHHSAHFRQYFGHDFTDIGFQFHKNFLFQPRNVLSFIFPFELTTISLFSIWIFICTVYRKIDLSTHLLQFIAQKVYPDRKWLECFRLFCKLFETLSWSGFFFLELSKNKKYELVIESSFHKLGDLKFQRCENSEILIKAFHRFLFQITVSYSDKQHFCH